MKKHHDIRNVRFEGDILVMTIDGILNRFPIGTVSPLLAEASEEERDRFEISPAGYGIHWPLLDEDISIDGLLGIIHTPKQNREPLPDTSRREGRRAM